MYAERRAAEPATDARYWPLWTMYLDSANYLEFFANCITRTFSIRMTVGAETGEYQDFGDASQWWISDSPVYFAVSYHWDEGDATG
ncbi:MAG: hypothetical protein JNM07_13860, partial [Phycisphaerae bacterium]|nr:hypothetical protein [Phycisphaerae bacterium]